MCTAAVHDRTAKAAFRIAVDQARHGHAIASGKGDRIIDPRSIVRGDRQCCRVDGVSRAVAGILLVRDGIVATAKAGSDDRVLTGVGARGGRRCPQRAAGQIGQPLAIDKAGSRHAARQPGQRRTISAARSSGRIGQRKRRLINRQRPRRGKCERVAVER